MSLHEVHEQPLRNYPQLIRVLAFHSAVKIVKEQIAARGLKLREFSLRELHIMAEEYLTSHRAELIRVTIARIRTTPAFLSLAEKEAKRRGRMSPLEPKSDGLGPGLRVLPQEVFDNLPA